MSEESPETHVKFLGASYCGLQSEPVMSALWESPTGPKGPTRKGAIMATLSSTTLTAGYIVAGDSVVMPSGDVLEVARWEAYGDREVALFTSCGERYLIGIDREVGIVGDHTNRFSW